MATGKKIDGPGGMVKHRVTIALMGNIKPDKFNKIMEEKPILEAIDQFCGNEEIRLLTFNWEKGDCLIATHSIPNTLGSKSKKSIAFIKCNKTKITLDNFNSNIFALEYTNDPLHNLSLVAQDVFYPLLKQPSNRDQFAGSVSRDILFKFNQFLSDLYVLVGQSQGQTLLPFPPDEIFEDDVDPQQCVIMLEGFVVGWSRQLKDAISKDSSILFEDGNPDPLDDLEFWKAKADDLHNILEQLNSEAMIKTLRSLSQFESPLLPDFSALCSEVAEKEFEAASNACYLRALEQEFSALRDALDFPLLRKQFNPLMQKLMLVWRHSEHFNSAERLQIIVQEVNNSLISQAAKYVSGEEIFRFIEDDNADDAIDKIKSAIDVCIAFKSTFLEYRSKALQTNSTDYQGWDTCSIDIMFKRLDLFLERCRDIMEFTSLVQQFSKMEKIFVGGTKGKELTEQIREIYNAFLACKEKFKTVGYDIMDISAKAFDADFYELRHEIKELERRLSLILTTGFDDMGTISARFQLIDGFEGLLKRPIVHDEFEKNQASLLADFLVELRDITDQFTKGVATPPIYRNLPPCSGAVMWCRGLRQRIDPAMKKLRRIVRNSDNTGSEDFSNENTNHLNNESTGAEPLDRMKEIEHMYGSVCTQIDAFESEQINKWRDTIDKSSEESLKKPVLMRRGEDDPRINVNFDRDLTELLREAKYFINCGLDIPDKAKSIYDKSEYYRAQRCQLQLITTMYNTMITRLTDAERPLLERQIEEIDKELASGFSDITWKTRDLEQFISKCQQRTTAVFKIFEIMQNNVKKMQALLNEYAAEPLCERKNKPVSADDFAETLEKVRKGRFTVLEEINQTITKLAAEIHESLTISIGDPKWKTYIDYVQEHLVEALAQSVQTSIDWMIAQVAPDPDDDEVPPLLEVQLGLFGSEIQFTTAVDAARGRRAAYATSGSHSADVWDRVVSWVEEFFCVGEVVDKIDGSGGNFVEDLKNRPQLTERMDHFRTMLDENKGKCEDFRAQFLAFEHLYKQDRNKAFKEFLASDQKVADDAQVGDAKSSLSAIPSLEKFQEKILLYKTEKQDIGSKPTQLTIGWLKVDGQPLKQALTTWVSKWSHTFTSFLKSNLINQINQLYQFMDDVANGLEREVKPGDLEALKFVLGLIHQVRVRQEETVQMFEPMTETIKFLRNHGVEIEDDCVKLLEDAPLRWESTVDKVYRVKETVNPLQNEQVDNIKRKVWEFNDEMMEFRQNFRENAPFQFARGPEAVQVAYQKMIYFHAAITEKEKAAQAFNQLENLFELQPSKYRQIIECRQENKLLKTLWDMIALVQNLFESWRTTLWNDIDTEELLAEVNKLAKRINAMDKEIRGWKGFTGLQDEVKMYQTVLPLVNLLHSPTMKDRHWKQLMDVTGTKFVMSSTFTLGDMFDLGLHNSVEEVEEVVEISDKEAKIEMQIQKLKDLWLGDEAQLFQFGVHDMTQVSLIRIPEEVLVNLEESMSILQGIKGQGKYAQHFMTDINKWEQNLGITETVIQDWLLVQGKWSSLQSIFMGSKDIREQLPEDSARFDDIDKKWRELMEVGVTQPQVVNSCCVEGRGALLEVLKRDLEKCEKSLNQYLETKKMAFPRFYFLSNVALLDLLSNGNNPQAVQAHMGDCFDNVKLLEFAKDDQGNPTKNAIGMYSKDGGEYVPFHQPFKCEGAVEDWLNGLVDTMRQTLREILAKAKFTADQWELEHPRHQWLYDYCAQIALTASQIIWTEEVESQFEALEDGNETAMKDYYKVCATRLADLIGLVLGDLNKRDRIKIMTLITVDVHNRDVVQMLVDNKIQNNAEFAWQAQMRYAWEPDRLKCFVNVADWVGDYSFEYIGNTGRLVITPLTDRCYITLTQALRLMMGGAPAGPAGTGKTETTKDLGRAVGIPVYVFNCSEQMNVMSLGNIFKGLCQTGAWGCFDEFNRIPIEVLSVVATQVGSFLNALRAKRDDFDLMGTTIKLVPTVGVFITMNPGYAGRTELPENLKALFRSCAMVVPDMELICENMLMSEGFLDARPLAHKFITLYSLSRELLSNQMHYDWGLRATKAVLRVAGGLKRAEPSVDEAKILMRALRDFNLPKIVSQDQPIFLRLISDLFRGLEIERKVADELNSAIVKVTKASGLQAEDMFVRKVTELAELFDVRHSVFVIGGTGAGKSEVWSMLSKAYNELGQKCVMEILNPKAVKNDELYGWLSASTGDWYDGLLSTTMRNMSRCEGGYTQSQQWKWLVLDGDIDPEWIESLNTVMDDNKVLTLVSNERIPLTPSMRLLFEISNLKNATPATVSRAGILFINQADVGWKPMIDSWIDQLEEESERSTLRALFNKYVTSDLLEHLRKNFKTVVPISDVSKLRTLCYLLEGALDDIRAVTAKQKMENESEVYEKQFMYACIWSFGGGLLVDESANAKLEFSNWWKHQYQTIVYPFDQDVDGSNTVFDYFYDIKSNDVVRWETRVSPYNSNFTSNETLLVNNVMVETVDSVRLTNYLHMLITHTKPALFVGTSGTGKTALVRSYLRSMDPSDYIFSIINLNSYTDATSLRRIMQQNVDKRSGRNFGPPGGTKLVYFVDDLNMPYVDTYGTQSPSALIRQHMDYTLWYDTDESDPNRKKKFIRDCQYIGSMNHKAGSFTVNDRLMSKFAVFSASTPSRGDLLTIYKSILDGHLQLFDDAIQALSQPAVSASIDLLEAMSRSPKFRPSSTKFHYQFNMRDISNVVQGLVLSKPGTLAATEFIRLWLHEATRVFSDRLVDQADVDSFREIVVDMSKKHFPNAPQDKIQALPLIFTSFVSKKPEHDKAYVPCESYDDLNTSLEACLTDYNENNAQMGLVLFEMAMNHVVRIARIIRNPSGNALLVGVGGSGKQSLTRLASWICQYEVFQIQVTRMYGVQDLLDDIRALYMKAGVKGTGISFMLTDSQVVNEEWLVYINDLLSSGDIPQLFPEEEKDGIYSSLRNEAKKAGGVNLDDKSAMHEFFINRVRKNLHVVLCFSPVGETFRVRCRKFPALINCTALDWFFSWPRDALCSVAERFLDSEALQDILTPELKQNIAHHMAEVHLSVGVASQRYYEVEKRFNYTTPKSFLELIDFYKELFKKKSDHLYEQIQRLDKGIATLQKTAKDVSSLKEDLIKKLEIVEEKKKSANELIERCGKERVKVDAEKAVALEEAEKANVVLEKANAIKAECDVVLKKAMPALQAAKNAVDCLTKASLTELKALKKPDEKILDVTKAVLILKDNEKKNHSWKRAQAMMKNVDQFKRELENFNAEEIDESILKLLESVLAKEYFSADSMAKISQAAANLCTWVVATVQFNSVYKDVAPKMAAARVAEGQHAEAMAKLEEVNAHVARKEAELKEVTDSLQEAIDEKNQVEADAAACQERLQLAERLVGGLADENERWGLGVENLQKKQHTLVGDVLLAAAFVSYIGGFNSKFRDDLWKKCWVTDIVAKQIPLSDNIASFELLPKDVLTTGPDQAKWANEGLPVDSISIENAAIVTLSSRWPLLIDPQQQGIKWIRNRETDLKLINLNHPRWLSTLIRAVEQGHTVLIENISENIDSSMDPVLSRAIIRKGRSLRIRIAGEEKDYDPNFQLYLQTKLSNPHYKPEIFAQCTLINFIVTEAGLEEQLLALVVNDEKPELEETKRSLMRSINQYMMKLNDLENELLYKLSNAPDDILSDVSLIEGLENTKKAAKEIEEKVAMAKQKEIEINEARNQYRGVAKEASWIYFLLIQLNTIDHMYQYSLDAFITFFYKAMHRAATSEEVKTRVANLRNEIRIVIFTWVSRGLFEEHKLIFSSQLTFMLMQRKALPLQMNDEYFQFLIFGQRKYGQENPLAWLPDGAWSALCKLADLPGLDRFVKDLVASPNRFKEWYLKGQPESSSLPLDWRKLDENDPLAKLCIVRCMRPDRMTTAVELFVKNTLPSGRDYTELDAGKAFSEVLRLSMADADNKTPIFFILSSGADPVQSVYNAAVKAGLTDSGRYHRVAMGQGQDVIAMEKLKLGHEKGHWVVLENIHLMTRWCKELEKTLDDFAAEGSHEDFRVFLSAEPNNGIPIGILERSIKLTNEPPQGMKANLKRAFASFPKEEFDFRESQVKQIQFALCWFHAVMIERKKYGPKGWNAVYPFNTGDLVSSGTVLVNKLENVGNKIPWADLQYIFGEIMYGGHITDDWDRLLCMTYLRQYMKDELFDELDLIPFVTEDNQETPHFIAPPAMGYDEYFQYIDDVLPAETPIIFGLHPNTEIAVRTEQSNALFQAIMELQPKEGSAATSGQNPTQRAASILEEILEKIDEIAFDLDEILSGLSVEDRGPYQYVFLQETDRMSRLVCEMKRSLRELDKGLHGELTMSERMEELQTSLFFERVPETWSKLAFPSLRALPGWIENLMLRAGQLQTWVDNPTSIPSVVNVSYLFNPQSFLTAVTQTTARRNNLELDKLAIVTEVTRKTIEDIDEPARDGAFICGLNLEGAKWNASTGCLDEAEPREMFSVLPVVNCKTMLVSKLEKKGIYPCPVYQTQQRGPTYVFTAPLRTRDDPDKWVLAGVVVVMDYVD